MYRSPTPRTVFISTYMRHVRSKKGFRSCVSEDSASPCSMWCSHQSRPVWIHGGAFLNGAGSGEQFNATKLLTQSIKLREPVVFVSINVSTLGEWSSDSPLKSMPNFHRQVPAGCIWLSWRLCNCKCCKGREGGLECRLLRSERGAPLGPAQHRLFRRRSKESHHLWRERWRQ